MIALTVDQWTDMHQFMDVGVERAAFLFTLQSSPGVWTAAEVWLLTDDDDYAVSAAYALELADHVRPRVIKHAHEHKWAVVEAHSHYWPGNRTRFSDYDLDGLREFAPHMLWRLPGRPYTSLVIGSDSFDGLIWTGRDDVNTLDAVQVDASISHPTGLSLPLYRELLAEPNG
jgi:hypothetical protein